LNTFNAIGRIGKDAELKFTAKGDPVSTFSVAVSSGYGDNQIDTWLNCSLFGKRAESINVYLLKGNQIGITGEIALRKYTTKAGVEGQSLECRLSNVTLIKQSVVNEVSHQKITPSKVDATDLSDLENDIPF
jgi:single-strand DNA-binding protein